MYLLITRNNPYLEELNKNPQSTAFQKDLDGIEIDLKNKRKIMKWILETIMTLIKTQMKILNMMMRNHQRTIKHKMYYFRITVKALF